MRILKLKTGLLTVVVFFLWTGCKKTDPASIIPPEPEIEMISFSPNQVKALVDPITFKIKYTDGDGDLGSNEQNAKNLFVRDLRIGTVQGFRIQQLAPDTGEPVPITGNLDIDLGSTILSGNGVDPEEVTFEIWVIDRAGNRSNTISAGPITVLP